MHSNEYRHLAYDMQLFYEGYPEDMLERAHDKLSFEKQRLLNIKEKDHIDTFEKFICFGEEQEAHMSSANKSKNASGSVAGGSVYEGGMLSPVAMEAPQTQHCTYCKAMIDERFQEFAKD